ncbi:MAG: hypothetical protein SFU86_25710 [Pirellulaceae bacterium]|nr:hypothetical protein [Pirellulaceae bacterium]
MTTRFSRWRTELLAIAAVALLASPGFAIYYELPASKDEYGLKYDVQLDAEGDKVNVVFVLADEGRLKSIYSATVIALSKPDHSGAQTHDLSAPIELKKTADGKLAGQVRIGKEFVDRAYIRILTLNVNGQRRPINGAAYYRIPLKKFLSKTPVEAATQLPPATNVTK